MIDKRKRALHGLIATRPPHIVLVIIITLLAIAILIVGVVKGL